MSKIEPITIPLTSYLLLFQLQDLAVRCIQRNVRKLMSVREWPWWRLYVKIAPLLNVHRTEDQLKARQVSIKKKNIEYN